MPQQNAPHEGPESARKALRQQEERDRELVESGTDIIYRADPRACYTHANPIALRVTGSPEKELFGRR